MKRSTIGATALAILVILSILVTMTPADAKTRLKTPPKAKADVAKSVSAITSMWAWGNSVDPSDDSRGLGEANMAPAKVADFASSRGLTMVYLSTPWASNQGAIGAWLKATVNALHAKGIKVSALGGDAAWISQPQLGAQWIADARGAAAFDAIQYDVEPWVGQQDPDFDAIASGYVSLLGASRAAAGSLSIGVDLPWWLATKKYQSGTAFDAIAQAADSVAIVTFIDHASGSDGILSLGAAAVDSAVKAGKPFTIGVETDLPEVAGGDKYTFRDEGEKVLEDETAKVRTAFASKTGYRGVTVEHMLAWQALIAASPSTTVAPPVTTAKPRTGVIFS